MNEAFIAVTIFVIVYAAIVSEKVDRAAAALIGGMAAIMLIGSFDQAMAFHAIDLNVLFLLTGMMVIANIMGDTGVFQWMGVKAIQLGKGNPTRIMQILVLVTAASSAMLDNVTVVVLLAPVTLVAASSLGISPIPFLIAEILASNIGGASTLIGDPPNILIGSAAGIDFLTFLLNMGGYILIVLTVFTLGLPLLFRRQLRLARENLVQPAAVDAATLITDRVLLRKSLVVLGLVLVGFLLHGFLGLESATIALAGASLLILWTRESAHKVFQHVEWATLMFFVGLFVLVEALVHVGVIDAIASWLLEATHGSVPVTTLALLWASAILSGLVDNIPYTATVIPVILKLGEGGMDVWPLWWALAMGADLGGNLTIIGASANVVVASFAERSGHRISFITFFKYGAVTTLVSMLIATLYLLVFYLR
jgi:Na+/H+ antiporter NhaD/arsenite permease-like protein